MSEIRRHKPGRIPCVVPFCRRTTKPGAFREWVCGDHWRLVDRGLKRHRQKVIRMMRRLFRHGRNPRMLDKVLARAWDACKAQAIERSAGIS